MTLQNNKNNSWTKSTLQSVNIPRPRTSEPNVNIKHAYYYNASVTMTMTHGGDIMPANTRFSCIVMCRVYSCTTPFSTPLFLVCFLLVNEAGIYYQLTLQYGCYFIVFCFCHQLPWWLWHGTSWILVWPAVIAMLLNCRWNHDFQSWHYQKCHWPATLWRCLYKMFCTKLNGISLNTCQDISVSSWTDQYMFFCILNGILSKRFDSFIQLVVYSYSVEMYSWMNIVSIDIV